MPFVITAGSRSSWFDCRPVADSEVVVIIVDATGIVPWTVEIANDAALVKTDTIAGLTGTGSTSTVLMPRLPNFLRIYNGGATSLIVSFSNAAQADGQSVPINPQSPDYTTTGSF